MLTMGGPRLWRTDNPQMPDKEPRLMADRRITVLHPTGQAFHWRRLAQSETGGLPNVWGRMQTGLVGEAHLPTGQSGVALPMKVQN